VLFERLQGLDATPNEQLHNLAVMDFGEALRCDVWIERVGACDVMIVRVV